MVHYNALLLLLGTFLVPAKCQLDSVKSAGGSIRGIPEETKHLEDIANTQEGASHLDDSTADDSSLRKLQPPNLRITRFSVVDANTNRVLFDLLVNSERTINLSDTGIALNIRATVAGADAGDTDTVLFKLNEGQFTQFDDRRPYSLFGDDNVVPNTDYYPGDLPLGLSTIEAIPYVGTGPNAIAGGSLKVTFRVIRDGGFLCGGDFCPSGEVCVNGICSDNPNFGCNPSQRCGPINSGCRCFSTPEGRSVCDSPRTISNCLAFPACPNGTTDCPLGSLCLEGVCDALASDRCVPFEEFCLDREPDFGIENSLGETKIP